MIKHLAKILLASLLLAAVPCIAQTYPATDSFSGGSTSSPVPLSSNWTSNQNDPTDYNATIVQAGGTATLSVPGAGIGMASYTGETFSNDQYAQAVVYGGASGDNNPYGPCVRTDANGNGYCYFPNGQNGQVYILRGGSAVSVTNGVPGGSPFIHYQNCPYIGSNGVKAGDTFQISAVGSTITCKDITTGTSHSSIDSTFTSGSPGLFLNQGFGSAGSAYQFGSFSADCIPTCNTSPTQPAATPTFSPVSGTYTGPTQVTISSTTPSATIYYTIDNTTPATTSTQYTTPITVSTSETIQAIATATGFSTSATGVAPYTINLPTAAAPQFSSGTGTYNTAQTISISTTTPSATIYYTTDGTAPATNSQVYSSALGVANGETLEAIATASGYLPSGATSATYTYVVATPTFSPVAGNYSSPQTVTIGTATPSATIHYTVDGTPVTTSSPTYSGAITVTPPETVEALATATGFTTSDVATAVYTSGSKQISSIAISPQAVSMQTASTQQFTAVCTYTDNSTDNCAAAGGATWSTSTLPAFDPNESYGGEMSVSTTGLLTAVGDPGQGGAIENYVLVTAGNLSDKAFVAIQHPGDTWYMYPTPDLNFYSDTEKGGALPLNVVVGSTVTIGAGLEINDAHVSSTGSPFQTSCNWSSSSTSIATVDRHGQVTGVAPGQVTITCGQVGNAVFGTSNMPGWVAPGNAVTLNVVAGGASNTTWYVLPGGGTLYSSTNTSGQCNGQVNQTYAAAGGTGSQTNLACAVGNIRDLWADGVTYQQMQWVIAGGDTVIVAPIAGGYNTGLDQASGSGWQPTNCQGSAWGCYMPTIPSGSASQHTKILGSNFASCQDDAAKTTLVASYGANGVINVTDSQFVDVACFQLIGKGACSGGYTNSCSATSNYGGNGILESALSSNDTYTDIFIHGTAANGIYGPAGVGVVANRLHIRAAPSAGIEMDDNAWNSGNISVAGGFTMNNSIIEWTGCVEEYPVVHNYPLIECRDQNTGGYADGFGTASTTGDWYFDHDVFQYNFQDGLDLLHSGMQNLVITNSFSQANEGQAFKVGSGDNIVFRNNIAMQNCWRIGNLIGDEPASAIAPGGGAPGVGYVLCRANANLSLHFTDQGTYLVQNNTLITTNDTPITLGCESGWETCVHANAIFQNNVSMGYQDTLTSNSDGLLPGLIYLVSDGNYGWWGIPYNPPYSPDPGSGSYFMPLEDGWATRSNNIYFNVKLDQNYIGYPDASYGALSWCPLTGNTRLGPNFGTLETCNTQDPMFTNEPASPMVSEAALDNFNFTPASGSPLLGAGVAISGLTTDIYGNPRPNPPSIGAVEIPAPVMNPTQTQFAVSPNPANVGDLVTLSATVSGGSNGVNPTGTVNFMSGNTSIGTGSVDGTTGIATMTTSSLAVGSYLLSAQYEGDSNFTGSASLAVTEVVNQLGSTTQLAISSPFVVLTQAVTLTATVSGGANGIDPTGTVTFMSNGSPLGTGQVNPGSGIATYSTTSLPIGSYSLTAQYGGDVNFVGSVSSPAISLAIVAPPSYSLMPPANLYLTIPYGGSTTEAINANATAGYAGTVTVSCTTSDPAIKCSVAPPSLTFTVGPASSQSVTVSISSEATASLNHPKTPFQGPSSLIYAAMALWIPGSLFGIFGMRRNKNLRRLGMLVLLCAGIFSATALTGCNSIGNAPHTYTVNVNATDGTNTSSSYIDVTVQ